MKNWYLIILVFLTIVFFQYKRAKKAFLIQFIKLKKFQINKTNLKTTIIIRITNPHLPDFDISKVNIDLYLNNKHITPIKNVKELENSFIELSVNAKLDELINVTNIINAITGKTNISLIGNVEVKKGIFRAKIDVNETFLV